MNKMKILPIFILTICLLDFHLVSGESKAVYLPTFVPPLPRPSTAARVDNRLVKGPVRGPYDYQVRKLNNAMAKFSYCSNQGGLQQGFSGRGWAARYIDQVWGEQS